MNAAGASTVEVPLPDGAEQWNRALRGAYKRGYRARVAGDIPLAPYVDRRKRGGQVSWSRAFIRAWEDGYAAAMSEGL